MKLPKNKRSSLMTFDNFKSVTRLFPTTDDEVKDDYKKYEMSIKYSRMTMNERYEFWKEKENRS